MRKRFRQSGDRSGYTLGEMLVALVIGAMVLVAVLTVYGRANHAAQAILDRIESPAVGTEVLQLLAEDLDRVMSGEQGFTLEIKNGLDNGFARAQLVMRRTMRDDKNVEKVFEEITWRAGYDYDGATPGLVVYRGHEGVDVEDKLLDPKREAWEKNYPLVPLCRGVTVFRLEIPKGEDEFVDQWTEPTLPPGVRVTISFAQPHETVRGTWDVYDEEKIIRTIAIDKTRKIKFVIAAEAAAAQGTDLKDAKAGDGQADKSGQKTAEQPPRKFGDSPFPRATERPPVKKNEPVPNKPVKPAPGRATRPRS